MHCRITRAWGMGNVAGTRLPSKSDVNGPGWERPSDSPAGTPLRRSPRTCGSRSGRYGGRQAWRDSGTAALRSKGPVPRERLSPQQWARLELKLGKGRWRTGLLGPAVDAGPDQDADRQAVPRRGTPSRGYGSCCDGTAGPARPRSARRSSATKTRSRYGRARCARR